MSHINSRSELFGLVVLGSLAAIAVGGWWARRRDLATLALVALVTSALSVWTLSSLPQASVLTIVYSDIVLWPVGIVVWVVWLWTAATMVAALAPSIKRWAHLIRASENGEPAIDRSGASSGWTSGPSSGGLGVATVRWLAALGIVIIGVASAIAAATTIADPHLEVPGGWSAVALVPQAAAAVTKSHPTGPIALYVNGSNADFDYGLAYGVIWQLRQDGRDVTASEPHWQPLGQTAKPTAQATALDLRVSNGRVLVLPAN